MGAFRARDLTWEGHVSGEHILAIDQGTTSSRAIVFDGSFRSVGTGQQEFPQHFPHSGWVEHDPEDLWTSTLAVCREALAGFSGGDAGIAAIADCATGVTAS